MLLAAYGYHVQPALESQHLPATEAEMLLPTYATTALDV